jgi:hypothetical protein
MGAFDPRVKSYLIRASIFSALVMAIVAIAPNVSADSPTLSGRWSATAMRSDWNIGDWGKACGPAPSGGGAPAGPVTVSQVGGELSFKGAGRDFTTAECWEQYPGLTRASHSGGARSWRSVCKTAAGDPRQASIVTTISATDGVINFDETGQYQFIIKGQNCTASARRTRTYALVLREGESPPELPAAKPAEEPRAAEQPKPKTCTNPGSPERLEVRPLRKLMRPGESFAFRAAVLDAQGCALPLTTTWKLVGTAQGVRVTGPAKVEVDESAPEAEVMLQVTVADRSPRVFVEVASRERYDALLAERGLNRDGESNDAAIARIASESIGGRATVARDEGQWQKRLFVGIVGGAALLLGVVGFLLVRRSRTERNAAENAPSQDRPASTPRRPRPGVKICPTCREEYAEQAEFCPLDGNRLVLASGKDAPAPGGGVCPVCGHGYDPGISACPKHQEELVPVGVYMAARAQAGPISRKICPVCGAQFGGESEFCGRCGASLVPVN